MAPQKHWCHNLDCPARGQTGQGNIQVPSQQEQGYRCETCRRTFAATTGTPFYRLRTAADVVTLVLILLGHGCPRQAIVAAFGLDERTVGQWQARAGWHCQQAHEAIVQQGRGDGGHVQADERWVKLVGKRVWRAMALAVPARLGLGGSLSPPRDCRLITDRVQRGRAGAASLAVLVCVDGLASDVTAFGRGFGHAVRPGRRGRPRLGVEPGLLIGQVIKRSAKRRGVGVGHRVVLGTAQALAEVLSQTGTGAGLHTAYLERLNATFGSALAPVGRRGRAIAPLEPTLTAGMDLVGCAYNFCWSPRRLRWRASEGACRPWRERTPAMAAGLTDHPWTRSELLRYQGPLPPWGPPKRPRRLPQWIQAPLMAGAT